MKCHTLDYPQLLKLLSGPKTNAAVVLFRSPKLVPLTTHGNPLLLVPIAAHSVAIVVFAPFSRLLALTKVPWGI